MSCFTKKWRRRVRTLERQLGEQLDRSVVRQREVTDLREKVRRLELLVGSGVVLMLNDLARHTDMPGAGLTIKHDVDYHELNTTFGEVHRIPAVESYDVTYEAPDGTTWENGVAVSKEHWKV